MTSSIKTFLSGKNPHVKFRGLGECPGLVGSQTLHQVVPDVENDNLYQRNGNEIWLIDVLDDGTAINYCIEVEDDDPFYNYL